MDDKIFRFIKNISKYDINVKKNYKLIRKIEMILNPVLVNKNDYRDIYFELDKRKIRVRIFGITKDKIDISRKVIVFIHGGGWTTGSIESYTNFCYGLSKMTERIVLSIDYRLASEYPFPNGFNDCYEVIQLLISNILDLNCDFEDFCLMGESAGANLVAAVSLKARKTKDFKIDKQILLYPALQTDYSDKTKYRSVISNGKDYLLTQKQLQEYIELYFSNEEDKQNVYAAPLLAKRLFFQPRTLIVTADLDPLRDEGLLYAKRLKRYFNKVEYYNIPKMLHGFFTNPLSKKQKKDVYEKIIKFLND